MSDELRKSEPLDQFHERLLRESRELIARSNRLLEETADLVQPPSLEPPPPGNGDADDQGRVAPLMI